MVSYEKFKKIRKIEKINKMYPHDGSFANVIKETDEAKSDEIIIGNEKELNVNIIFDVLYACKKHLLIDLECECYKFIDRKY